jgi:hypothetical protein
MVWKRVAVENCSCNRVWNSAGKRPRIHAVVLAPGKPGQMNITGVRRDRLVPSSESSRLSHGECVPLKDLFHRFRTGRDLRFQDPSLAPFKTQ